MAPPGRGRPFAPWREKVPEGRMRGLNLAVGLGIRDRVRLPLRRAPSSGPSAHLPPARGEGSRTPTRLPRRMAPSPRAGGRKWGLPTAVSHRTVFERSPCEARHGDRSKRLGAPAPPGCPHRPSPPEGPPRTSDATGNRCEIDSEFAATKGRHPRPERRGGEGDPKTFQRVERPVGPSLGSRSPRRTLVWSATKPTCSRPDGILQRSRDEGERKVSAADARRGGGHRSARASAPSAAPTSDRAAALVAVAAAAVAGNVDIGTGRGVSAALVTEDVGFGAGRG